MLLRTMQAGKRVDIPIRAGEVLLLPAHVPHSPQRFADTVGLVIERRRRSDEADGFLWYCERCDAPLYSEYLHVKNIETDLPPVFERFWANPEHTSCRQCGAVMHK
jgi:3-hydroxyanthranilate 3,4-dioxygenase